VRRPSPVAELTSATLAFSAGGMFPKLIHGDALALSFARGVFAALALGLLMAVRRTPVRVPRADVPEFVLMGILSAGNWAGYFAAIQVAGVSVAVIALFTYPLLTALLEPWLFREPHNRFEILAGIAVVAGVCLVVPSFDPADHTLLGVLFGIGSALSFTFRNLLGRRLTPKYGAMRTMLWQFVTAIFLFAPFGWSWVGRWTGHEWLLLFVFGAVVTSFSQTLFVSNLQRVSTSYASLLTCAQPVITVAMAVVFLDERPATRTLLGGAIVTATVIAVALRRK
jgi:drug/metabolite transporter (DMT)-like permease